MPTQIYLKAIRPTTDMISFYISDKSTTVTVHQRFDEITTTIKTNYDVYRLGRYKWHSHLD